MLLDDVNVDVDKGAMDADDDFRFIVVAAVFVVENPAADGVVVVNPCTLEDAARIRANDK